MSETDTKLISQVGDKHVTYTWDHDDGGKFHVNHVQDVEPYLERNKRYATSDWNGYDDSKDFRFVGTVPDVIALKWLTDHGVWIFNPHQQDGVRRLMNDPDYQLVNPTQIRL